MNYSPYSAYKDSGIEWLGDVPAHWQVKRLKQACQIYPSNVDKKSYDNETSVSLCNYTDVYYNDRITVRLDFMTATASPEQIRKFTLRAGDTIITKDSESADDIAIAAYVPEDLPGVICGYHLAMVRPLAGTCGAFVKWFFDSSFAKARFAVLANGLTRVGLGQYALDNASMPLPSMTEQVAISAFLDRETARIDAAVARYERLITLLGEKRQALISHTVTKGLDPDAPMKDSGVKWLGEVPAQWQVKRLRHLTSEPLMYGANEPGDRDDPQDPRFVRITDIDERGALRADTFRSIPTEVARPYLLQEGDVLLARSGATVGKSFIYRQEWGTACFAG